MLGHMNTTTLPSSSEMYRAFSQRDSQYEGIFFVAVKTTGIFCRPTCPARKPHRKHVLFFPSAAEAVAAGYRACKRCEPLEVPGTTPDWLASFMRRLEAEPLRRWTDLDIRNQGLDPVRLARWFKKNHGVTFQYYSRCQRLAGALAQLSAGDDPTAVAFDAGYESLSGFRDAFQKWLGTTPGRIEPGQRLLTINRIPTPLGPMLAAADEDSLWLLEFADRSLLEAQVGRLARRLGCQFSPGNHPIIDQTHRELTEYFAGERQRFTIRFQMPGTDFQRRVWKLLLEIPYGETRSYEQLAVAAEKPLAQRAVGRANGDNRLAILVPCHRVLRSDGRLSGYAGGVRRKEWLLQHERQSAVNELGDS